MLIFLVAQLVAPQATPRLSTGETIVTATRSTEEAFDLPYALDVIGREQLRERGYRTVPQALRDTPGVMVQETSFGQGSPYVRGFTGFRNVFLIDGVRLNNSAFRDGPTQYWNTVDGQSLQRIEVLKGPAAVIHGSDAIGATVQAVTLDPSSYGRGFGGRAHWRGSSAEESHTVRIEGDATHGDRTGVLFGVTGRHFGELRGGRDIGAQPNTGYDEWAADLKVEHFLDADTRLTFLHQRVRQNDVPRTHSTIFAQPFKGTSVGSDLRRDLDQERDLTYLQLERALEGGFADSMHLSVSWHDQEESRDRIRSNGNRELQGYEVGTLGAFANFKKSTELGELVYGIDAYHDEVNSFSSTNAVQGPVADDATYDLAGAFLQHEFALADAWSLTLGGRATYAAADADSVLDPVTSTQTSIEDDWSAVTGSARVLYRADPDRLHFFGGVSQGFRAPNLSDLTRFDTARSNEFEIPAPGLEPEDTLTFELGAKFDGERAGGQVAVFYTAIQDLIVRVPTGNTNAEGDFEITKDNLGDGYVAGLELEGAFALDEHWSLFANATWLDGEVETYPTSDPVAVDEPIDRLMPPTGRLGVRWEAPEGRAWGEFVAVFADDADELSTRDQRDTQRIPPGGTPGFVVLHARGGWRTGERSTFDAALENLTDEDYRIHGSGTNMPGLNLIVGWTYTW
ncbi:MAG: TonB-dependent receptor [Planctomycetota bacterium]